MSAVFVGGVPSNTEARFQSTRSNKKDESRLERVCFCMSGGKSGLAWSAKPAADGRCDGVDKVQRARLMHAGRMFDVLDCAYLL